MADAAALFATHQHRLFLYLCRAVGHSETARDLTQDVFVRVTRAQVPETGEGELGAWLFRIARNLALDHHRQRQRRPEVALAAAPEGRAASQDVSAAVNEALATLEPLDRDVFLLREVAGLGYAEIAAACDVSHDAVRSRLHRVKLQLREQLAAPIASRRQHPLRHNGTSK